MLAVPVVYSGGFDVFNLPKELAFRAEAILLLAALAFWAAAKRCTWSLRAARPATIVVAAVVAWAAITTLTSTNRALSADTLITIAAAAAIFLATLLAAQTAPVSAVDVVMIGACANAALVIVQELKIWSPFVHEATTSAQYASGGFLGNTNYIGAYLAAPALAAIVLTVVAAGRRRWIYAAVATLLVVALILSATRTALAALIAGLMVFAFRSRRGAPAMLGVVAVIAVLTISPRMPLGAKARELIDAAKTRDYEQLFSERLLPSLAAIDMIRDHPLLGVGPGCFRFNFMSYRLRLGEHYPAAWTRGYPGYWSAVHDDHLEVAAETGLPGYALFLAAIVAGAGLRGRGVARSRGPARRETPRPRVLESSFARAMRWPLAALVFVLCLAQFPLELAAPRLALITLGALCMGWDGERAAD